MHVDPETIVHAFTDGRISRRELVARLLTLGAAMAGGRAFAQSAPGDRAEDEPTFQATGLDHIALAVTDIARSRDWYVRHLGLKVSRQGRDTCFLTCGDNFVALFRRDEPGLHHYSYALPDYDPDDAVERLRKAGLEPDRQSNRVYFQDPDGLVVQVSRG